MADTKRIILIDGHSVAYRAYHAIPPLTTPSGEPSNAVFGFANMLLKALDDLKPDYVVATFDAGRTFRHDEYEEYKAHRAEMPDDMRAQMDRIHELVEAFHVPILMKEGYEADDLLGTLARQAHDKGLEVIIVTGDSDTFQLASDSVRVLYPQRTMSDTKLYDRQAVRERYGLEPEQLADFKALVGDSSDSIPGVPGVGEKTASRLLKKYGSVESIYEHLDEITPARFRKALAEGRASALLSKRLATIVRDVEGITLDLEASAWGRFERSKVLDLFRELGFTSLVSRIPGESPAVDGEQLLLFGSRDEVFTDAEPSVDEGALYIVVDTQEALKGLAERLRRAARVSLDTETTSTDAMRCGLVGIGIADAPGSGYYIPVGHDARLNVGRQLPLEAVRDALAGVFADPCIAKVCHNAKFDLTVMARHGMPVQGTDFDTMIAAWLVEPSGRGIGLKAQALQRFGVEMTGIDELIGSGRDRVAIDKVSVPRVARYCCADADYTLRLVDPLTEELKRTGQWELFTGLEMPLVKVLMAMEMHGMAVDTDYLAQMSDELSQRLGELAATIYDYAGCVFNINSTKQLGEVLFDALGLPVVRRTRTGYSTDAAVLEALRDKHPIIEALLEYRQLEKLKGTYVDALPELVSPDTGRIHTWLSQTATSTGRLSSSDPNLQNIPVRTEEGRKVRRAFVAPEGHRLVSCDYSQVELRLLAHLSEDPELVSAFQRDEDVHASTAAAIFGQPLEEITGDQRALAKTINFGLMYGMSDYGLSARTDLSVDEARAFIDAYFQRFRRVREYLDSTIEFAREHGYVQTIMGRRRYFPELRQGSRVNASVARAAERAAINMPIQGSAADIIKLAMIRLHDRLEQQGLDARMVLQVHDELVLEVPEEELDQVCGLVVDTMESAYELNVPLKVELSIGHNWMEIK